MSAELSLRDQQLTRAVDTRQLRRLLRDLLTELLEIKEFNLSFNLVDAMEMTRLNETYLKHAGSTDVITFHYSNSDSSEPLVGEIFVCVDEALIQARRFRTTWQEELVRYLIHGMLHLRGHDDHEPNARRRMKREENRLLKELDRRFRLSKLERKPTIRG